MIPFRFDDSQVFLLSARWCPSEGHQHGVSIQSSINLVETLFRITQMKNLNLGEVFYIYQSSFISQLHDLLYWMVTIFIFQSRY